MGSGRADDPGLDACADDLWLAVGDRNAEVIWSLITSQKRSDAYSGSARETSRAGPVDIELVTRCPKASGQFGPRCSDTSVQVVELSAIIALEVMMMRFAGNFVSRRIARYFDRLQPSFLDQSLNISVYGRNPECGQTLLRSFERFFRRQRPARLSESLPNRYLLPRLAFIGCPQILPPWDQNSTARL